MIHPSQPLRNLARVTSTPEMYAHSVNSIELVSRCWRASYNLVIRDAEVIAISSYVARLRRLGGRPNFLCGLSYW